MYYMDRVNSNFYNIQDPIDLDWIDLVNKGKNPDIRLYFHLEDNK